MSKSVSKNADQELARYRWQVLVAGLVLALQFTYRPRTVLAIGLFAKPTTASPQVDDA